jgi:hypothetical protein
MASAEQTATQIFYVPPHKLSQFLEEGLSFFGDTRYRDLILSLIVMLYLIMLSLMNRSTILLSIFTLIIIILVSRFYIQLNNSLICLFIL